MYQGLFLHTYVHALYQVLPDWMTHAALMSDINEGVQELGIFWISLICTCTTKKYNAALGYGTLVKIVFFKDV